MGSLNELILSEEKKIESNKDPNLCINVLYNLITLKNKLGKSADNYVDYKRFVAYYIELIKNERYGYDRLNHKKILKILNFLDYGEKASALNYSISLLSKELPEHEKDWFLHQKHRAEIALIFQTRDYRRYFKAILLFCALGVWRVFFVLLIFLAIVTIILLPASSQHYVLFHISYDYYSDSFILNHFLNICCHLADVEKDFSVEPANWIGVGLLIFGKVIFISIVVNFFYRRITDKLYIK